MSIGDTHLYVRNIQYEWGSEAGFIPNSRVPARGDDHQ